MKKRLIFALLLMGFTSLVVQVLLIREFLICFYGNELTIGLILGNWIILEAIGSSLASKFSQKNKRPFLFYCILQCLIALYFPCAIYLIRVLKNFLPLVPGEGAGIIPIFISSFFILAPLSIFDGAQFPLGCRLWKDFTKKPLESVGSVYIFEAMGFILAGPIFTFIFITRLHSFQIALIISLLNLLSGFLLLQKESKFLTKRIIGVGISLAFSFFLFTLITNFSNRLNSISLKKQWQGYTLIDSQNSIYGNLAVTKEQEQYTFFSDGIPIITTPFPDIISIEEFVHFSMLSHPNPKHILMIGGGAGGPIYEILKYPVTRIDYAELDPLLIKIIKQYPTTLTQQELDDPRVSIKIIDGARFVKNTSSLYDIIFINLPPPTTLQLNRFYTKDFFSLTKRVLKDDGIIVFRLPGSLSYLNVELQKLNLSIFNTLKDAFKFAKVIPGDSNIYLASKSEFDSNDRTLIERLKKSKISTRVLTPFFIKERLHSRWQDWFYSTISKTPNIKENTAFSPIGIFYGLSYWNSLFSPYLTGFFKIAEKINLILLLLTSALLSLLVFLLSFSMSKFKKLSIPYAILTTGMLGITLDLVVIFIYQSFYGYVYHHLALLITSFMAGLTLGGWLMTKRLSQIKNKKINFMIIEAGLVIFSLALAPLFVYLGNAQADFSFVFFVISMISGFLVGSEFPLANSLFQIKNTTETAGILYAIDLLGSWIGALIVSIILIPLVGLIQTCLFLAVLKLSSLVLISRLKI